MNLHFYIKKFLIILILINFTTAALAQDSADLSPARAIAETLKSSVQGIVATDMRTLMLKKYQLLHLIDEQGSWKDESMEQVSEELLPQTVDQTTIDTFIDRVASAAEANLYLKDFLDQTKGVTFTTLFQKVDAEGTQLFPDVIAYAMVLDRLTKAMRDNWKILAAAKSIWTTERDKIELRDHFNLFEIAKITTVEYRIGVYVDEYHQTGVIPSYSSKLMLPVNILEAVLTDQVNGFWDNAVAGLVLANNPSGSLKFDQDTGAGPTRWSDDGKAVLYSPPLPLQWADLYASWNMAFVSQYENFPYFLCKLLIPQVNDFQQNPEGYLYNRVLALYTHAYFTLFERVNQQAPGMSWHDKELTKLWGSINKVNAGIYQKAVWKAKYLK